MAYEELKERLRSWAMPIAKECIDALEATSKELEEQARLLGMSAEREAALLGKVEQQAREIETLETIRRKLFAEKFKVTAESSVLLESYGIELPTDDYSFVYHIINMIGKQVGQLTAAEKEHDALRARISELEHTLHHTNARLAACEKEMDALERNAARYKWFRQYKVSQGVFIPIHTARTAEEFDAAVDEGMSCRSA